MLDRKKVIRGLECLGGYRHMEANPCAECGYNECQSFSICIGEVARDAIELLKEHEPKRHPTKISRDIVDEFYGYMAVCPLCNCMWIMYRDEDMKFCPGCGMAVKWDD